MECNKDEAARAKEIAERKFSVREYAGSKKFALKALNLYPALEGLSQFLTTLEVYISAENKINGEMDWYGILGVNPFADEDTVRKQYRKLVLTLHPDKNKSIGAEGAFKLVSEAWSLLSDKVKRIAYNQKRSSEGFQHNTPKHVGSQSEACSSNGFCKPNKNSTSSAQTGNNNAQAHPSSIPPHKKAATFWTICNQCRTHYEYLRIYLNHTLLCPSCNEAFVAIEKGPPLNVVKSSKWSSGQHPQKSSSQQHSSAGRNHSVNPGRTNFQWGSHSRMAGFFSTDGPSSVATASVKQHSSEIRRECNKVPSTAAWKRNHMSKRSDGSFSNIEKPVKKIRTDDIHMYMANHMTMKDGSNSLGRFYESGKADMGTERNHGFSGMSSKHYSTREMSLFELRNMLIDKALTEIGKKLQEWRSMPEAKITNKDKGNKGQKSTLNDKTTGPDGGSTINGNRHVDSDSIPVTSDAAVKENQSYVMIHVPDPDFHNFDLDRTENSFEEDQVWASYDDDDGMPRYYARIHKVILTKPFRMRISWLNSRSNTELGPIDWIGSGFCKTCGDFRIGRHEITESLNSFSHKVRWTKGTRGVVRIFPGMGQVWALYRNWSPDWNENTPDEVIHKYDMVEVLEDFNEEEGVSVTPLVKVDGFRTVFHRQSHDQVRKIPKAELFRFSHQVPNYLLTGQEAHNALKGCRELDPAATPLDLHQTTEANEALDNVGKSKEDTLADSPEKHASIKGENASNPSRVDMLDKDDS
ncbi:uncharacterized protein LOC113847551 isoform X2 [Abrus precatorius]|uniref:Uncharacterized protein LOC113847551 isoform X2 n=1 Tax=Abrus precatorius TaxID=3816 RepID=A0A8B8JMP6_ABRPR|nr:uncharacterized protein LOC113847551 isoform X2 [Abrus precatorius]